MPREHPLAGATLSEILIAVVLIGTVVAAVVSALLTSVQASATAFSMRSPT